jgi:hypothetical protein
MSPIIQTVSINDTEAKCFREKLSEHLGIHRLTFVLTNGDRIDGLLSEVGSDYLSLIMEEVDVIIPIDRILFCRFSH